MLVSLDRIEQHDLPAVGGKGLNLARMMGMGLPVPPGFCVTTAAYREHLEVHGLREAVKGALLDLAAGGYEGRSAVLADLREMIAGAPMAAGLRDALVSSFGDLTRDGDPRVAVRSSATAEDLPQHSFAGQHDTFLGAAGISECLRRVKDCWASLWTERAFEYRRRSGMDHLDVEMAVIVQKLVPADTSGVIFTADPITGRRDKVVIEATYGLGEALVSGRVTPHRVTLSRPDLAVLQRETAAKRWEIVARSGGGTTERSTAPARAMEPCLDDGSARQLGRLALEVESAFGPPMDIEWALSRGEPWLLQARPITTVPGAGARTEAEDVVTEDISHGKGFREDKQVWTNANAGEVLPDVATPMTWSMLEPVALKLLGVGLAKVGLDLKGHVLLGLIAGRAYFNLNAIIAFARKAPGAGEKDLSRLFGGRHDVAAALGRIEISDEDIPEIGFNLIRVAFRIPGLLLEILTLSPGRVRRVLAEVDRKAARLDRVGPQEATDEDLAATVSDTLDGLVGFTEVYELVALSVTYQSVLYEVCRRWFGDGGGGLASRLLAGLGNNENANAGLDLWRMAALAGRHGQVRNAILRGGSFAALRREAAGLTGGEEFLAAWDAFMREHGHHCRGEIEIMNPRWSEEPDHILDQVRSYVRASGNDDFLARYGRLARDREAAAAECRRRLWNPLKRLVFEFLLDRSRRYSPLRENIKSRVVRWFAMIRLRLMELGDRLTARGVLRHREDIFFLQVNELQAAVHGEGEGLREVASRRAEYDRNLTLDPPAVVVGRFDPDRAEREEFEEGTTTLEGVAANPGVVTGTARVILRAGADQVEPGEILVAPFTDPGWTPFFLNAAAIVMDMGGILSHGSIIAREYGIPAVVNVGPATKIIKTGQRIQVDGGRGVVRILD